MMLLSMLVPQIWLMFSYNFNGIFLLRRHDQRSWHGCPSAKDELHDNWYSTKALISRCEESALSLCLDGGQLEQTQRLLGLDIDPSLYLGHHTKLILGKKLWKRVAVLARIKKFLPVNCRIILFNASIKPILEYCVSVWGNCNAGLLDEIFKVQKSCVRIILGAPSQARTLPLFLELGWLPINQICIERRLLMLKKILDGRAPD